MQKLQSSTKTINNIYSYFLTLNINSNIKPQYGKFYAFFEMLSFLVIIAFFISFTFYTPNNNQNYSIFTVFSIFFAVEYALRIFLSENKIRYIRSFMGLVDFTSFLSLLFPSLYFFRVLRLAKIFRLLSFLGHVEDNMVKAITQSFLDLKSLLIYYTIFALVIVYASALFIYLIEHKHQPEVFTSIADAMWWCMVTITTVGYGDMVPISSLGRTFTSIMLIMGIILIAIPTALITSSISTNMIRIGMKQDLNDIKEDLDDIKEDLDDLEEDIDKIENNQKNNKN